MKLIRLPAIGVNVMMVMTLLATFAVASGQGDDTNCQELCQKLPGYFCDTFTKTCEKCHPYCSFTPGSECTTACNKWDVTTSTQRHTPHQDVTTSTQRHIPHQDVTTSTQRHTPHQDVTTSTQRHYTPHQDVTTSTQRHIPHQDGKTSPTEWSSSEIQELPFGLLLGLVVAGLLFSYLVYWCWCKRGYRHVRKILVKVTHNCAHEENVHQLDDIHVVDAEDAPDVARGDQAVQPELGEELHSVAPAHGAGRRGSDPRPLQGETRQSSHQDIEEPLTSVQETGTKYELTSSSVPLEGSVLQDSGFASKGPATRVSHQEASGYNSEIRPLLSQEPYTGGQCRRLNPNLHLQLPATEREIAQGAIPTTPPPRAIQDGTHDSHVVAVGDFEASLSPTSSGVAKNEKPTSVG